MLVVGTIGAVAAITVAVAGVLLVDRFARDATETLDVVETALSTATETVALASESISDLEAAISTGADAAADVGLSLRESEVLIAEIADITGTDLPVAVEAIDDALPAIQRVAGAVDGALSALRFVGVDYNPDRPFDDAVADLDVSLDPIPERLRRQSELLTDSAAGLEAIAGTSDELSVELSALEARLEDSRTLVADYDAAAADAVALIDEMQESIAGSGRLAKAVVVLAGLALLASQVTPLYLGATLRQSDEQRHSADRDADSVPDETTAG